MTEPQEELLQIADRLDELVARANNPEVQDPLTALISAVDQVGKSWSGSFMGYHANVYYADLKPPTPGENFSPEWGLTDSYGMGPTGDWHEFDPDEVEKSIYEIAGGADLSTAKEAARESASAFESARMDVLSVLTGELAHSSDSFLESIKGQVEGFSLLSEAQIANQHLPQGTIMSRDTLAITQGVRVPPHIRILSEVRAIQHTTKTVEKLGDLARKAGSHLLRQLRQRRRAETVGTNVFIGHGRSPIWRELKDFIEGRLKLPADEFNRVPVAGITNTARLAEMLDAAAIAFLVMTGEDEQPDGNLRARMNVVHEAGLFQGRLGFNRAIVVLEDGCEAFSNIEGLGQIRFPKGNIEAKFEAIRQVLEREGLLAVEEQAK